MKKIKDYGQLTLYFEAPSFDGEVGRGLKFKCGVNIVPTYFIDTIKEHRNVTHLTFHGYINPLGASHIFKLASSASQKTKDKLGFKDETHLNSPVSRNLIIKVCFYEIADYISDKLDELYGADEPAEIDTKVPEKEVTLRYIESLIDKPDPPFGENAPKTEMIWVPEKKEILKVKES